MEALRTKVDGLQWEVNRLDAENRKLRDEKPEQGDRLDLAAELERAKGDVAELMKQREGDEREIDNTKRRADAAERRVTELEARVRELEGESERSGTRGATS